MMDANQKRDVANRLKSVEGHIRGIQRMVEEDAYCMDILKQVKAVQQALERVSALTLENHLHTCVTTALRSDNAVEQERVIDEIMDVLQGLNRDHQTTVVMVTHDPRFARHAERTVHLFDGRVVDERRER